MIYGLTHTQEGTPIQRLSVSTKIAVGLPPSKAQNRKAPVKLDYFLFLRRTNATTTPEAGWEPDPELTKFYEKKTNSKTPREIEIVLLDDEMEEVFPSKLAWWKATQCHCWGDGLNATRRTEKHPEGEQWSPDADGTVRCGKDCPDLKEKRCKPSGDLRFMLADFPQLGAISRIHTTSYRSVMQIHSALMQVRTITGGRLSGIRASLVVRAEKTSYLGNDNARHSTVVPILSLEIKSDGLQKMVDKMIEGATVFQQTRKLLGSHVQVVEDDEQVLAGELEPEFYRQDEGEVPEKRQARRERERGVVQPGKEQNRGHGNEGFGKQQTQPAAAQPAQPTTSGREEPPMEGEPSEAGTPGEMCGSCDTPHPRSLHEGDVGDGPCIECQCPGFSSQPPPPKFDTVLAAVSKEGSAPKWADLRRVAGKVISFENTDRDGAMLKSQKGAEFVIIGLFGLPDDETKDPHAKFFCYHKTLFDPLQLSLGEKIVMAYAVQLPKNPGGTVYQMIHDIQQIGVKHFDEKKTDCPGAGIRGTIRTLDPMNQEPMFNAEDENQAAP